MIVPRLLDRVNGV